MRRDSSIFETSVRSLINYYYYYAKLKISLYTCFLTCFFFTNTLNKNRLYQLTENKIYLIIGSLRFNLSGFRTSWAKFFQSFFLFFSTYHSITIIMYIRNAMYSPANDETLVKFEEFLQLFLKYRCAIKKMVITVDTVPWKNKKIRKKKTYIYIRNHLTKSNIVFRTIIREFSALELFHPRSRSILQKSAYRCGPFDILFFRPHRLDLPENFQKTSL